MPGTCGTPSDSRAGADPVRFREAVVNRPRAARPSRRALRVVAGLCLVVIVLSSPGATAGPFRVAGTYLWNRTTDFLDILRCGIAVGPVVGAEIAVTDRCQLGAYAAWEAGTSFPHFIPPLWPLTAADGKPVFIPHKGGYSTVAAGPWRRESSLRRTVRYERAPAEARVQLGLGLVHLYASLSFFEVGDFFLGILGLDPMQDDAAASAPKPGSS